MLVVGIAGGTGSGKTTVVKRIIGRLPGQSVVVIPQDSYYRDNSHVAPDMRKDINFDHPESIEFPLLVEHLEQLKAGFPVEQPVYSYITCTRMKETVQVLPRPVIILEGILILIHPPLRELMDIKVYVDADADDRLSRVIHRDIEERGRDVGQVLERYEKTVKPMHLQFIEPTKRYADIIVPQGGRNLVAIDILTSIIEKNLNHYENNQSSHA